MSAGNLPTLLPTTTAAPGFQWLLRREPREGDALPTPAEEATLRRDVEASLRPVTSDALRRHIGAMVSAFPQQGPTGNWAGYQLALAQHLSGYPDDVAAAACQQIVRQSRFLPAVSEVLEIAERLVEPRRQALRHLDAIPSWREAEERARERRALAALERSIALRIEDTYGPEARRARWRLESIDQEGQQALMDAARSGDMDRLDGVLSHLIGAPPQRKEGDQS